MRGRKVSEGKEEGEEEVEIWDEAWRNVENGGWRRRQI